MKTTHRRWGPWAHIAGLLALSSLPACSNDDDPRGPSDTLTGTDAGVDGAAPPAEDAGKDDAVADADAGPELCEDVVPSGPKPSESAKCDPAKWTKITRLEFPTSPSDVLRAMTPDELTLVRQATNASETKTYVVDRSARDVDFGAPVEIEGFATSSLFGLSPDGLRICGGNPSGAGFLEAVRGNRGDAFGEPSEGTFSVLDADAAKRNGRLDACVIAPDDRTLYYNFYDPTSSEISLHVSRRTNAMPWPVGTRVTSCALSAAFEGASFYPTGVSSDDRTLFLQAAADPTLRMATRAGPMWPITDIVELAEKSSVVPNQGCDRIYFSGSKDGIPGLFFASSD